jgi:hypothetical protein
MARSQNIHSLSPVLNVSWQCLRMFPAAFSIILTSFSPVSDIQVIAAEQSIGRAQEDCLAIMEFLVLRVNVRATAGRLRLFQNIL